MADKIRVSKSGSGAPTAITPDFLGQIYIDEDTGTRYEATALTEGSWVDKLSLKENTANKKTKITSSDTDYPTCKAVETGLAAKQASLGYTAEDASNKETTALDTSTTKYPCNNVVKEAVDAKQDSLGYTAENSANKKTILTDSDTDYPTCKAVETGLSGKQATMTKASGSDINTGTDNAKYVTSKAIADSKYFKSIISEASSATPAPTGNYERNEHYLTALATDPTFSAPSGTPANGNQLIIRIKDDGTARTLAFNAIYRGISDALPSTTTISKTMYLGFKYNSSDSKWDLLGLTEEE